MMECLLQAVMRRSTAPPAQGALHVLLFRTVLALTVRTPHLILIHLVFFLFLLVLLLPHSLPIITVFSHTIQCPLCIRQVFHTVQAFKNRLDDELNKSYLRARLGDSLAVAEWGDGMLHLSLAVALREELLQHALRPLQRHWPGLAHVGEVGAVHQNIHQELSVLPVADIITLLCNLVVKALHLRKVFNHVSAQNNVDNPPAHQSVVISRQSLEEIMIIALQSAESQCAVHVFIDTLITECDRIFVSLLHTKIVGDAWVAHVVACGSQYVGANLQVSERQMHQEHVHSLAHISCMQGVVIGVVVILLLHA
mmetsp:Transcript_16420/g.30222  ORF Transcript_16420/g.30222 Transcript_16420/m.30222 type:complete len:310 (+) Transcript_16420:3-932(+)